MKLKHVFKIVPALLLASTSYAGDAGTIYTDVGLNGIGIGYAKSVSDNWALRGQYNSYTRSYTGDISDTGNTGTVTATLKMNSVQLLGDWYPGDTTGFRFTGGVVLNNNKVDIEGNGTVNGKAAAVNGTLRMSKSPSPYLGIGYSVRPKMAKGFGFTFDFGVMQQDPSVDLSATGAGVTQADIDAQKAKITDAMNSLKTMPVLAMGLSYSF